MRSTSIHINLNGICVKVYRLGGECVRKRTEMYFRKWRNIYICISADISVY